MEAHTGCSASNCSRIDVLCSMNIRFCGTSKILFRLLALRTLLAVASAVLTYPAWCAAPPPDKSGAIRPEVQICLYSPADQLLKRTFTGAGLCSSDQAPNSDLSEASVDGRQCSTEASYSLEDSCDAPLVEHETPVCKELGHPDETSVNRGEVAAQPPASEGPSSEAPQPAATAPHTEVSEEEADEDRQNFASARDGAKLVAANKEAKKAAAVLDNDSDTFCKNECKADKWLILELSQVAKVDTLELSQFELYSSRINAFEVRGRQNHPRHDGLDYFKGLNSSNWKLLGNFEAASSKGTQVFRMPAPAWVKYLQLRLLSHHGSEAVCALNDVRVFGKSAADDLEDQLAMESTDSTRPSMPGPPSAVPSSPTTPPQTEVPAVAAAASDSQNASESSAETINTKYEAGDATMRQPANEPLRPVQLQAQHEGPSAATSTAGRAQQEVTPQDSSNSSKSGQAPRLEIPPTDAPIAPTVEQAAMPPLEAVLFDTSAPMAAPQSSPIVLPADVGGGGEGGVLEGEGLQLLPGQGNKAKQGVYDVFVTELRALKLQQKSLARSFTALEQNASAAVEALGHALGALALEVSALERRLDQPALAAAGEASSSGVLGTDTLPQQVAALHQGQCQASFIQAALLAVIAMFGGVWLAIRMPAWDCHAYAVPSLIYRIVLGLATLNGICAFVLQLSNGWDLLVLKR